MTLTSKKFEGTDYAGFFHPKKAILLKLGADPAVVNDARAHRQMIETGICGSLCEALAQAGLGALSAIQPADADPPDCWAQLDGQPIGIEITELVSERARRVAGSPPPQDGRPEFPEDHAIAPEALGDRLHSLLRGKDKPSATATDARPLHVLIHTDEALLTRDTCREVLAGRHFGPFDHIHGAWLMLSYDPSSHGYPIIPLVIARSL